MIRLLWTLLSFGSLISCSRTPSAQIKKKVIVLGIDAMDPGFLERHWTALPNLNRLRQTGDFQRLATTVPPQSPVAWSTFITGMDPGGHGVFDFVHRDPATMQLVSSLAEVEPPKHSLSIGPYAIPVSGGHVRRSLQGQAFWQLLDEAGVPVTLLRMPNNFPPLQSKGRTLSGMGTPDMKGTFGTFTYFTNDPLEIAREVPGGRIVTVDVKGDSAELRLEGPANTLRSDRAASIATLKLRRDATAPVALISVADQEYLLKEGEWSSWIPVEFPLIPHVKSASGMIRIFMKALHPDLQIYVSPVNLDPLSPELPISTPPSYSRDLASAVGRFYTQGIAEDTAALRAGVLTREQFEQQTRIVGDEQFRILEYELQRFTRGFLFIHYLGVDQDSHVSWGAHDDDLLRTYQRVDREVGRVMRMAADADLFLISDHGFASFGRAVNLNTWLMQKGFLALRDSAIKGSGEPLGDVDWSRTKAYSVGLNAVYLNLAGRERSGIVQPSSRAAIVDDIAARLRSLKDPANGQSAVTNVYRTREVYHGAAIEQAPDLIVGWADGYRSSWQTTLGAVPASLIEDNNDEWRGDHCIAAELVPGVFLSNRKAGRGGLWLGDMTVTVLQEFGIGPAKGMRGRSVF